MTMEKARGTESRSGDVQDRQLLLVVGGIVVGTIMDGTIVVLFIPHPPHLLFPHSSAKVHAPDYPMTNDP